MYAEDFADVHYLLNVPRLNLRSSLEIARNLALMG